jgi:hypothetical protein
MKKQTPKKVMIDPGARFKSLLHDFMTHDAYIWDVLNRIKELERLTKPIKDRKPYQKIRWPYESAEKNVRKKTNT